MGSIMDWGHTQEEKDKITASPCENSEDGKHDWEKMGSWPSSWGKCMKCGKTYYNK